jgi:predicted RecA/RadA family phage recombinase
MQNAHGSGQTIQVTLTGTVTAGVPFLLRDLLVVPLNDGVSGETITCYTGLHGGEFTFAAETGAGQDWEQGEKLYWDASEARFTVTSTDNTFAGFAAADKTTAAATGRVLLSQIAA